MLMVRLGLRVKQAAIGRAPSESLDPACGNPGTNLGNDGYNGEVPTTLGNFQIRDFQASDFDLLWTIDQACFAPGISYSRNELKTYMRRRGSFTLVAQGDAPSTEVGADLGKSGKTSKASQNTSSNIAGFIVAEAERGAGHIVTIDVIAGARRYGVGSLLLSSAEGRLRKDGCRSIELEAAVDNISALLFYKRHGYSVVETFPRYYSNGVDALVLQKEISVVA
jgi:ribosomal-protein-alanine N-acetyltransferase